MTEIHARRNPGEIAGHAILGYSVFDLGGEWEWPQGDRKPDQYRIAAMPPSEDRAKSRESRPAQLFNLVADPGFLLVAWDRVRGNKGAATAGVDGQTAASIAAWKGVEGFLVELLRSGGCTARTTWPPNMPG